MFHSNTFQTKNGDIKLFFLIMLFAKTLFISNVFATQAEYETNGERRLLFNGGFEAGEPADFGTLKGWEVSGNLGYLPIGFTRTKIGFAPSYLPKQGQRMAIFSAGNNDFSGVISQSFDTVPMATYSVKLAMGVTSESMGKKQAIQVSVADGDGAFILTRIEIIASLGKGTTWNEFSAKFVAIGKRTRISINDFSKILPVVETSNSDLLVDDVSIARNKTIEALSKPAQ